VTRSELATAIRDLADDEKLELLGELWDSLDHDGPMPEWHKAELDRRLDSADGASFGDWTDAKARLLGSK
jgi:putative addiction module component (TIGR02574 family)